MRENMYAFNDWLFNTSTRMFKPPTDYSVATHFCFFVSSKRMRSSTLIPSSRRLTAQVPLTSPQSFAWMKAMIFQQSQSRAMACRPGLRV